MQVENPLAMFVAIVIALFLQFFIPANQPLLFFGGTFFVFLGVYLLVDYLCGVFMEEKPVTSTWNVKKESEG